MSDPCKQEDLLREMYADIKQIKPAVESLSADLKEHTKSADRYRSTVNKIENDVYAKNGLMDKVEMSYAEIKKYNVVLWTLSGLATLMWTLTLGYFSITGHFK